MLLDCDHSSIVTLYGSFFKKLGQMAELFSVAIDLRLLRHIESWLHLANTIELFAVLGIHVGVEGSSFRPQSFLLIS